METYPLSRDSPSHLHPPTGARHPCLKSIQANNGCRWRWTCRTPGDGGGRPSSVMSLGVASVGRPLPWASGVRDRCGICVERYRPQIPRALGCQRGLALADLGCTVDHLGPTPANLSPPSLFAVSCDLKALWPGVLGCWGMGGRCPNVAHKAPRSIYTLWPRPTW